MMPAARAPAAWTLGALLEGFGEAVRGAELQVTGLAGDSASVTPGALFLARAGRRRCGLEFLDEAVRAGAVAVAWDAADAASRDLAAARERDLPVPLVPVPGLGAAAGRIAARFHGEPSRDLLAIGVTGTDGKTSVTRILAQALDEPGWRCAVVGTLGAGFPQATAPATHTTPDPVALQATLARLRAEGARAVAMEVSSHALDQDRVAGVHFDTAVFTNLGRDHLDYHGDETAYGEAKARLFAWPGLRHAVINAADPFGRRLIERLPTEVGYLSYGIAPDREAAWWLDVRAEAVTALPEGLRVEAATPAGAVVLESRLLGRFNAENLLAALAALLAQGIDPADAARRLAAVQAVPGRMERFGGGQGGPLVVVDYAHTPRALEAALSALREHTGGALWCVFGCGGERDRGKRPLMGAVAEALADRVVITNDNARGEDPGRIVAEIRAGLSRPERARVLPDRREAIATALAGAGPGDTVLVAGKGHEESQWIDGRALPFSDRALVAQWLEGRR